MERLSEIQAALIDGMLGPVRSPGVEVLRRGWLSWQEGPRARKQRRGRGAWECKRRASLFVKWQDGKLQRIRHLGRKGEGLLGLRVVTQVQQLGLWDDNNSQVATNGRAK